MKDDSCASILPLLQDLVEETLPAEARGRVEAHLDSCSTCSQYRLQLLRLRSALRALPGVEARTGFWPRVYARLHSLAGPRPALPKVFRGPAPNYWRLAPVYAVAGLALVVGVYLSLQQRRPAPAEAEPIALLSQHATYAAAQPLEDYSGMTLIAAQQVAGTRFPRPAVATAPSRIPRERIARATAPEEQQAKQAIRAVLAASGERNRLMTSGQARVVVSLAGQALAGQASGAEVACEMNLSSDGQGRRRLEYEPAGGACNLRVTSSPHTQLISAPQRGESLLINEAMLPGSHAAPASAAERFKWVLAGYKIRPLGRDKVAAVGCVVVELLPKIAGKPTRRLWIEPQTGRILRWELLDPTHRVLLLSEFLRLGEQPPSGESANLTPQAIVTGRLSREEHLLCTCPCPCPQVTRALGFRIGAPPTLPGGYLFVSVAVSRTGAGKLAHLRYSDGVDALSVFQQPLPTAQALPSRRAVRRAAVALLGDVPVYESRWGPLRALAWTHQGTLFWVVGDADRSLLVECARHLLKAYGTAG